MRLVRLTMPRLGAWGRSAFTFAFTTGACAGTISAFSASTTFATTGAFDSAWAARIAKVCRCHQELRVFGFDPAS